MANHIVTGKRDTTLTIDDTDATFTVAEKARILVPNGVGIDVDAAFTGNTLDILGAVHTPGINGTAIAIQAAGTVVHIGATGSVVGNIGLLSGAVGTQVSSNGTIEGADIGMVLVTESQFVSHGDLSGGTGLQIISGTVENDKGAHITGDAEGIQFIGAGSERIVNHGLISSSIFAIELGESGGHIVNDGRIDGIVKLGSDGSVFDTRGGTLHGAVQGSDGSDTYLVSSDNINIIESVGGGTDTLKSTVSASLPKNVEILRLIGHGDIDGHGTAGEDDLFGNAGDNRLTGGSGGDFLNGGAGNDELHGGGGADGFDFIKGGGTDIIVDFTHGEDGIGVVGFSDIRDFSDLEQHIQQHDNDVWIRLGHGDKIIVRHEDAAALDDHDFFFQLA